MKDKKPQFKSKSLPGLSKEELNKMTHASLASQRVGKANVESGHLDSIRPMALAAWLASDYWGSEEQHLNSVSSGTASSKVNLAKNNVGSTDSNMSNYKRAKKAKERAKLLLNLNEEFTPKDAKEYFSNKQWGYVRQTDLVIMTGRKGGYHNTHPIYKLDYKNIEIALNTSDDPKDYFKN